MTTRKEFITESSLALLVMTSLGSKLLAIVSNQSNHLMKAPETSSADDFDFYIGKWKIHNRKVKSRLTHSDEWEEFDSTDHVIPILDGIGDFGQYHAIINGKSFAGITLRLFDPQTKLWSLYWADSISGKLDIPVVGYFQNRIGKFYCKDVLRGKVVDVMFHWDATDSDHPIWSQAFSNDGQKTWEWNWYMYNERVVG